MHKLHKWDKVGCTPRLHLSFKGNENELASKRVNACAGVRVTSNSLVQTEEMRLAAAICCLKVSLSVTLRNMCCEWEGEIAQHASHHCKHVRAERQAFPNKHAGAP